MRAYKTKRYVTASPLKKTESVIVIILANIGHRPSLIEEADQAMVQHASPLRIGVRYDRLKCDTKEKHKYDGRAYLLLYLAVAGKGWLKLLANSRLSLIIFFDLVPLGWWITGSSHITPYLGRCLNILFDWSLLPRHLDLTNHTIFSDHKPKAAVGIRFISCISFSNI